MNLDNDLNAIYHVLRKSLNEVPYTESQKDLLLEGLDFIQSMMTDENLITNFREEYQKWYKSRPTSKRTKHNSQSRASNMEPDCYYLFKTYASPYLAYVNNKAGLEVPEWGKHMSSTQRSRVRKQATKLNITCEEYIARKNSRPKNKINNNKDHSRTVTKSEKAQRKEELRDLAHEINSNNLSNIKIDKSNVKITTWDSLEMKHLIENDDAYSTAKGPVFGLIHGTEEIRQKTFVNDNNSLMSLNDIKSKVMNLITDQRMLPIEEKFSKKVGNLAALPFKDWADKVITLWQEVPFNPDIEILEKAIKSVKRDFTNLIIELQIQEGNPLPEGLTPLSLERAYEKVRKGRNSGYPYFTNKWNEKEECVKYYKQQAVNLLNGDKLDDPRILFKRTQNAGETVKMRPVECPPKSEAIAAKVFTDRIISAFKKSRQFCGFNGGTNIDEICVDFLKYEHLISSDFSEFDMRAKNFIPIIFDMMKEICYTHYHDYFDNMKEYYLHAKLITPLGLVEGKDPSVTNGLNSGDGWTSVIGTLSNAIANKYCEIKVNQNWDVLSYGDDCVIGTNDDFDAEAYSKHMSELGMLCNPSKQEVTKGEKAYFSFLGYYYFKEDLNKKKLGEYHIFPIMRALPKLIYVETEMRVEELVEESLARHDLDDEEAVKILTHALDHGNSGLQMLASLQRLENCHNHVNFGDMMKFFTDHEPNMMDPTMIIPFASLKNSLKGLRVTKSNGVFESHGFMWLLDYHSEIKEIKPSKELIDLTLVENFGFGENALSLGLFSNVKTQKMDKRFMHIYESVEYLIKSLNLTKKEKEMTVVTF